MRKCHAGTNCTDYSLGSRNPTRHFSKRNSAFTQAWYLSIAKSRNNIKNYVTHAQSIITIIEVVNNQDRQQVNHRCSRKSWKSVIDHMST
uniref:Uncharacterized protein n=1 Tax=Arundo donax TaxID=35708 RepID=A0A0A9DMB7_ARUDO